MCSDAVGKHMEPCVRKPTHVAAACLQASVPDPFISHTLCIPGQVYPRGRSRAPRNRHDSQAHDTRQHIYHRESCRCPDRPIAWDHSIGELFIITAAVSVTAAAANG